MEIKPNTADTLALYIIWCQCVVYIINRSQEQKKEYIMLYQEIRTGEQLQDKFQQVGRDYYSLETYEAIIELFDGESQELDIIGLCCDIEEMDYQEAYNQYDIDVELTEDEDIEDTIREAVIEYLTDNTMILFEGEEEISFFNF